MHLSRVRLTSYMRFRDSGDVSLAPGFNVIVGANDVGKSAFVSALSGGLTNRPHRSLATLPLSTSPPPPNSVVDLIIDFGRDEIANALRQHSHLFYYSPSGDSSSTFNAFREMARDGGTLHVKVTTDRGTTANLEGLPESNRSIYTRVLNSEAPRGFEPAYNGDASDVSGSEVGQALYGSYQSRVYAFRAERLNVAVSSFGENRALSPDARNLPEVLNNLQQNRFRFTRFLRHVTTVFPHVSQVAVSSQAGQQLIIKVWDIEAASEREDLAIPLSESGTGIGQVLAMLYVVVTADEPRVIIIDEPHSFLHPGALRKLFQILVTEYSQHQYIVTTNSPAAILAVIPATVHIVERESHESRIKAVDVTDGGDLRRFLDSVGASLSDVFGPDRILWVEGKTEETCLPVLLDRYTPDLLAGVAVVGIVNTGDLEKRGTATIFEIYRRLSNGASLIPPAIAFVLDSEGRSQAAQAEMVSRSGGLLQFLPRRMFENYLLNPAAIAGVLNAEDGGRSIDYTEDVVRQWMRDHGKDSRYWARNQTPAEPPSTDWHVQVHGADLLDDMFSTLTKTRVSYDKMRHGLQLTHALTETGDSSLRTLATDVFRPLLEAGR
jgi:energy-coupling factor transporter ATP-binding protein EcfA2